MPCHGHDQILCIAEALEPPPLTTYRYKGMNEGWTRQQVHAAATLISIQLGHHRGLISFNALELWERES